MITVIAGVNGAGKSSIAGAHIRASGGDYFNPDEVTRELMANNSSMTLNEANSKAWTIGFEQLNRAIANDDDYIFETTLGGNSISNALHQAIDEGREVSIFYCGLSSADLHIERVATRVARGGHDIPEEKIRQRWENSIINMIELIPICSAVRVFDNSTPADSGGPKPICLFYLSGERFIERPIVDMPDWAKPLASTAIRQVLG
jgi:predicted ABC-type ATPase